MPARTPLNRDIAVLFMVMLVIGAGNTALQSIMPTLGRSLRISDSLIALAFSLSGAIWVVSAPFWAARTGQRGHKRMVMLGLAGFAASMVAVAIVMSLGLAGVLAPALTIGAFVVARALYGTFGSAAPPAAQAMVAGRTSRDERTRALTLLASAFGLGTIIGPAVAPFMVVGSIGLAGPAYGFALLSVLAIGVVAVLLKDAPDAPRRRGAFASYPSIGGAPTGASARAGASDDPGDGRIAWRDPRILPWLAVGVILGHAQAMTGQAVGFLTIDRLGLSGADGQQMIGLVLMAGAGAALLVQWGLIPLLDLAPRTLIVLGLSMAALGCLATGLATTPLGIATAFALASAGFGFARPGYTSGSSLAVGPELQNAVAGKVTSVNGLGFVLGPSLGVGMYELWQPFPYVVAAAMCVAAVLYSLRRISPSALADAASPDR